MVKYILLITALSITSQLRSQSLHLGVRVCPPLVGNVTIDPRDYYFFNTGGDDGHYRLTSAELKFGRKGNRYIPEMFFNYQFKNDFFLQAGFTTLRMEYLYRVQDPDDPEQRGIAGRTTKVTNLSVALGYYLAKSTVRPYAMIGIVDSKMNWVEPYAFNSLSPTMPYEYLKSIENDVTKYASHILYGKVGAGFKFYAAHIECYYQTNLTPLEAATDPVLTRINTYHVAIGYHLLSTNLVKKKKQ